MKRHNKSVTKINEQSIDNEDEFDRVSQNSDISVNTDARVFNGAIGKIAKINKTNQEVTSSNAIMKNIQSNVKNKKENLSSDNKIKNLQGINLKKGENGLNIKINTDLEQEETTTNSNRKLGSPLSFRPKIIDEIEKININKEVIEIKEESSTDSENDKYGTKKMKYNNKKEIDKPYEFKLKKPTKEKFSEKNYQSNSSNKSNNSKDKKQNEIDIIKNMMSICVDTDPDNDVKNPSNENNVFWNMKQNNDGDLENFNSRRSSVGTTGNLNGNFSNSGRISNKLNIKTNSTSQISCTISKIEKGIAILVSNDDNIFSLPVSFLPKSISQGNTYMISIDETCSIQKKLSNIKHIQKRYLKK